jgi:hypothetical protein
MCAFHGQVGMFVRALSYMLSHGRDGIRQASEDAVLSANYVLASLKDVLHAPFGAGPCMHEALFDEKTLHDSGVSTLDFAKVMIDEGYHPMTVYFPLVVHGAMLIEPTESESKESLDRFIHVLRTMAGEAQAGKLERFEGAPRLAPRRRLQSAVGLRLICAAERSVSQQPQIWHVDCSQEGTPARAGYLSLGNSNESAFDICEAWLRGGRLRWPRFGACKCNGGYVRRSERGRASCGRVWRHHLEWPVVVLRQYPVPIHASVVTGARLSKRRAIRHVQFREPERIQWCLVLGLPQLPGVHGHL